MHKELKKAIVDWIFENEDKWQRVNECAKEFRPYIYTTEGGYLIGGREVYDFIVDANKLIYPRNI